MSLALCFALLFLAACVLAVPLPWRSHVSEAWLHNNFGVLRREVLTHRFCFIVESMHQEPSPLLTALQEHSNVSVPIKGKSKERDGLAVQNTIDASHRRWPQTEESKLNSESTRVRLYAEWRVLWDVSKPVLVQRSPEFALTSRLMQALFSADDSYFVIVLRHPLAAAMSLWKDESAPPSDCFRSEVADWIFEQEMLFNDLPHIQNKLVVRFEDIVAGHAQGIFNTTIAFLGLPMIKEITLPKRYNGTFDWIEKFERNVYSKVQHHCDYMFDLLETSIGRFGYSFHDLRSILPSPLVDKYPTAFDE